MHDAHVTATDKTKHIVVIGIALTRTITVTVTIIIATMIDAITMIAMNAAITLVTNTCDSTD